MKQIFFRSLIAVAAFALTGCAASHGTSPKGLEIPIGKAAVKFAADTKANAYKVVTTEELKRRRCCSCSSRAVLPVGST